MKTPAVAVAVAVAAALFATLIAGDSFDGQAYPVKWSPRGEVSYAAPPPPGPPRRTHRPLMVKDGVLFLKGRLFDGAVLPAKTELGLATPTPTPTASRGETSTADHAPPPQFGYANLGLILSYYKIGERSEHARQVAATLLLCSGADEAGQKGEPQACATTLRAAMDFAAAALGTKEPRALRTVLHGRQEPLQYVVAPNGITGIGGAVVPCHPLPYPTDVLYCHRPSGVQALRVELVGKEDASLGATAIAVCHEETTDWDEDYFLMLNGTRGEAICHYMPAKYLLWIAS